MNNIVINNKIFKPFDEMYYISESGDVYSTYCNKILKQNIDRNGYHRVDIHGKHFRIHRLVYLTWIGDIPPGLQINHKDDNRSNNHYTNLYAGTQKQNINDCIINGNRAGNFNYLTVYDREIKQTITFSPTCDFIEYSGHTCGNGSIKRMFGTKWFNERYEIIDYGKGKV